MEDTQANFSIKYWAEDDQPREKLMLKGKAALSDAELIAILIGSGSRNESAVQLSKRILKSVDNSLNALGKLSHKQLMEFKGSQSGYHCRCYGVGPPQARGGRC